MNELNNNNYEIIKSQNEPVAKKLEIFEKDIEESSLKKELTIDQIHNFSEELKDVEGFEDLIDPNEIKNYTLDQIISETSYRFSNSKDKKNKFSLKTVEKFSQQGKAIFILKTIPTIRDMVTDNKSAELAIHWMSFLNTNDDHLHSQDVDELVKNSMRKISEKSFGKNAKKSMENVVKLFEITQKNCSPKILDTFNFIINSIYDSELYKDEQKKDLAYELIPHLKDAILCAYKNEILSPFVCGESQLFTIIDWIGKILSDDRLSEKVDENENVKVLDKLQNLLKKESNKNLKIKAETAQADLDTIVGLLYDIYFRHMDKYGNIISISEKQSVLKRLIPHDNSGRNEFFVTKISERISSPNYSVDNFSNDFDTDVLEIILRSPTNDKHHNRNTKIKCVKLIGEIYVTCEEKNRELDGYIKESFENEEQIPEVNEVLIKKLFEIYSRDVQDKKIKTRIASLILEVFNNQMDFVVKNALNEFKDFMRDVFRNEYVDKDHKEDFFDSIIKGYKNAKDNDRKALVYEILERCFSENYSEISKYTSFKSCFDVFIDQLKNTNESPSAYNCLSNFLKDPNIPTKDSFSVNKKTLLFSFDKDYDLYDSNQKEKIFRLIKSAIDSSDKDFIEELRETVVHFMNKEINSSNNASKNLRDIVLPEKMSVGFLNGLFKIILSSNDSQSEWGRIFEILEEEIMESKIDMNEKLKCYQIMEDSFKYKNDKKLFVEKSLDMLSKIAVTKK